MCNKKGRMDFFSYSFVCFYGQNLAKSSSPIGQIVMAKYVGTISVADNPDCWDIFVYMIQCEREYGLIQIAGQNLKI